MGWSVGILLSKHPRNPPGGDGVIQADLPLAQWTPRKSKGQQTPRKSKGQQHKVPDPQKCNWTLYWWSGLAAAGLQSQKKKKELWFSKSSLLSNTLSMSRRKKGKKICGNVFSCLETGIWDGSNMPVGILSLLSWIKGVQLIGLIWATWSSARCPCPWWGGGGVKWDEI